MSAVDAVYSVFDRLTSVSSQKSADATSIAATAIANVKSTQPKLTPLQPLPVSPLPSVPSISDLFDGSSGSLDGINSAIGSWFSAFLDAHYPTAQYAGLADTWLHNALAGGGTGISESVENRLWERDRTRLLKDAARATDEAMTTWMARGFAIPPGALIHQAATIERDAQEKISESSRERVIKSFDAELENVRLAVKASVELRNNAISAANAYLAAAIQFNSVQSNLTIEEVKAKLKKAELAIDIYKTDLNRVGIVNQYAQASSQLTQEGNIAVLRATTENVSAANQLYAAALQAAAQQAAAALNGLHVQAGISGSDVTTISIEG